MLAERDAEGLPDAVAVAEDAVLAVVLAPTAYVEPKHPGGHEEFSCPPGCGTAYGPVCRVVT